MGRSRRPEDVQKQKAQAEKSASEYICTCNKVSRGTIEGVISRGCQTMPKIFTATTAGVGQCGGSCRPTLQHMLDTYLATGRFPKDLQKHKK